MTELQSRFRQTSYQDAAGKDVEIDSFESLIGDGKLKLSDLPTTVVDNKTMYDLDAAVDQGLLAPPHKSCLLYTSPSPRD